MGFYHVNYHNISKGEWDMRGYLDSLVNGLGGDSHSGVREYFARKSYYAEMDESEPVPERETDEQRRARERREEERKARKDSEMGEQVENYLIQKQLREVERRAAFGAYTPFDMGRDY